MANKVRLTGFTRFLLFMIFVVPIAYVGASYYNGEDGLQNIKELLNFGQKTEAVQAETPQSNTNTLDCQTEIDKLQKRLERRERYIKDLEAELDGKKSN